MIELAIFPKETQMHTIDRHQISRDASNDCYRENVYVRTFASLYCEFAIKIYVALSQSCSQGCDPSQLPRT